MDSLQEKFLEGQILLVDKPYTWTSFDVVGKIRYHLKKELGLKKIKVGHAGTLDPLATGLLIVCTGKFTKKIDSIQAQKKEYTGIITLGATTPSYDLEKPIDQTFSVAELTDEVIIPLSEKFIGEQFQTAPIHSAKKIDGKRAYELARKGEEVVMKQNQITIYDFDLSPAIQSIAPEIDSGKKNPRINVEPPYNEGKHIPFRVVCSKGTYIRSIARDLGVELDCGGHLGKLRRTKIGDYNVANAFIPTDENVVSMIKGLV